MIYPKIGSFVRGKVHLSRHPEDLIARVTLVTMDEKLGTVTVVLQYAKSGYETQVALKDYPNLFEAL
jgi:hypothetical protein